MRRRPVLVVLAVVALTSAAAVFQSRLTTDAQGGGPPRLAEGDPVVPGTPAICAACTDLVPVTEFNLMGGLFNLVSVRNDEVFFTAGSNCLGRLDAAGHRNQMLCRQGTGPSVWDIHADPQGNLWFSAREPNAVGYFQPNPPSFTEWRLPANGTVFGMDIDAQSGDVWLAASGAGLLYRLQPATNQLTSWAMSAYTCCYDVDWDPATASLWFVAQGCQTQGVGRLNPATNGVTVWPLPTPNSGPNSPRVANDGVWFTERSPAANAIAQLLPDWNTLREYRIPLPNADAMTCLPVGDSVWFTGWGGNLLGRLQPSSSEPTTTALTPVSFIAQRTTTTLSSSRYTPNDIFDAAAPAVTTNLTRTVSGGFTLYQHPQPGIHPSGLALDASGAWLWYGTTDGKRIGRMATGIGPPTPSPTATRLPTPTRTPTRTPTPTRSATPGPMRARLYLPVVRK